MGSRVPFMFAAGLSFLNWMYGYFVLPESLPADQRRKFDWKTTIPGRSLLKIRNYPAIGGLAISFFLISLASHAVQTNWSFFTIEKFGWSEKMIGISLGVVGLLVALVQGLLIRYTSPLLGNKKYIFRFIVLFIGASSICFCQSGLDDVCIPDTLLFGWDRRSCASIYYLFKCSQQ